MKLVGRIDNGENYLTLWEGEGPGRLRCFVVEIVAGHATSRVQVAGNEFLTLCAAARGEPTFPTPYFPPRQ